MIRTRLILATLLLALALARLTSAQPAPPPTDSAQDDLVHYKELRSKLKPDDAAAALTLARWCRSRELWSPMADMARDVLNLDPQSESAYALLREYDEKVVLPPEDAAAIALEQQFHDQFDHTFRTMQSRHFLLIYDTSEPFARRQTASLEKAYDAFFFWFNLNRLRPNFLENRLVVLLFKSRKDYQTYSQAADGNVMSWAAGYYSSRTNRAAFYDDSSGPSAAAAETKISDLRAKIDTYDLQISKARRAGQTGLVNSLVSERNVLNSQLFNINSQVDNTIQQINQLKVIHEACHELAFNTGIQKLHVDYPDWLSEGLACSFESQDRHGGRGPGIINYPRLAVVRDAIDHDAFLPLEKLLPGNAGTISEKSIGLFYAESWALFNWLYKNDRADLEKYLLAYQTQRPGTPLSPARHRQLFIDAFGDDLPGLQRRWREYLNDLPARQP